MSPALIAATSIEDAANPNVKIQMSNQIQVSKSKPARSAGGSENSYTFKASGQTVQFDGFLKLYPLKLTEEELPKLRKDEPLALNKLLPEQHFTQPPPRYSEASLIKTLEKEGIGRPSTYAPILETIQQRNYYA